jgi:hypothetical protein
MGDPTGPTLLDESNIEWQEAKSEKGKAFRIGVPKAAADTAHTAGPEVGGIDVDWPPRHENIWIPTSPEVRRVTGITRYKLLYNPKESLYEFTLWFTNDEDYDYHFEDKTGDVYRCNTFRKKDHYVQYNSKEATVVRVAAEA